MPAHITITNRFDKSIITVSASKYFRNMQETCTLSAKNLVNDHGSIVYGPVIENNTCVIKAKEGGMDMGKSTCASIMTTAFTPFTMKVILKA